MGEKKFKLKIEKPKIRRVWPIKPVTRIKGSAKVYNRKKEKQGLWKLLKELREEGE